MGVKDRIVRYVENSTDISTETMHTIAMYGALVPLVSIWRFFDLFRKGMYPV